jgi:hypothetical protein
MKKTNHNTHHPENSPTNRCGTMDTDDEAAGRLRSTDLHRIIVAALTGHEKQPIHFHALRNINHTSLMCASYMANHPYGNVARSPIFKQQNIQSTNNLDDNGCSLSKMRSEIHKLKPEDLEVTIIEKSTSHPRTNGPNEIRIGDKRGLSTLICMDETYRILLSISQAMLTKKQFQFLIETMQLYHFKDEQLNNLKAILIDNKDGFTDDQ